MLSGPVWPWLAFFALVGLALAADLGLFHKKSHTPGFREALLYTAGWVALGLLVNLAVWLLWPHVHPHSNLSPGEAGLTFLTGYVIEYSLSVDNLFVFVLVFQFFKVPQAWQHRVLFWGILGALLLRGLMIGIGAALVSNFGWVLYLFGAFLVYTGIKLAFPKKEEEEIHPDHNPLVRLVRRWVPVTSGFRDDKFWTIENGRRMVTPLFLVLLVVETTDLVFAVDSIPAIFSITTDPFLVFSSNVMAILGLRSLYFLLAGAMASFHYLQLGLAAILTFVGVKMLLPLLGGVFPNGHWHIPIHWSLLFIVSTLTLCIGASVLRNRRQSA